jgi:transcriptional regulator with XRE-family HTH domain
MRRRTRWKPVGRWLKHARTQAGLTQNELAERTGISVPAISRFESNRAEPSFGDICLIAFKLGWPLLYFATGQLRHSDDSNALAAALRFWGLRDLVVRESPLLGEVETFEELFVLAARSSNARIVESLPALLLANTFEPQSLLGHARAHASTRRVGWLADISSHSADRLPSDAVQPESRRRLRDVIDAAWKEPAPEEPDYVGDVASREQVERVWKASPTVARRWKIACDIEIEAFVERARSLLLQPVTS